MSTHYYQNYGLSIISEVRIDSFTEQKQFEPKADTVFIQLATVNYKGLPYANNLIIRQNTPNGFVYVVKKTAAFLVIENRILVEPLCEDQSKWQAYLTGAVMSIILTKRGRFNLHGSAIEYLSSAYLFLGNSGVGKSSVTAALGERGYAIITDDVCTISRKNGQLNISNGTRHLRLMEDTLNDLKLENAIPLKQTPTKFAYAMGENGFAGTSGIKKVIELVINPSLKSEIIVEKVESLERIELLKRNIYKERLSNALNASANNFKFMTTLCEAADFIRISRKRPKYDLHQLVNLIEERVLQDRE